jgi:hypothetical protein
MSHANRSLLMPESEKLLPIRSFLDRITLVDNSLFGRTHHEAVSTLLELLGIIILCAFDSNGSFLVRHLGLALLLRSGLSLAWPDQRQTARDMQH